MNPDGTRFRPSSEAIAAAAAAWVMRCDRGLSPEEQDAYLQWLAADSRHAAAMAAHRRAWEVFDRLAGLQSSEQAVPDPDLLAPAPPPPGTTAARRAAGWFVIPLAAVAAAAFALWIGDLIPAKAGAIAARTTAAAVPRVAPIEERRLEDGTLLRLNRGAVVSVEFAAGERRVHLERGEASFDVAKDPARPFVVVSAGVAVRAIGTAFNIRLGERRVEVIVTEGLVSVAGGSDDDAAPLPAVGAGQSANVPLSPADGGAAVATLTPDDLSRRLAWQPRMLTFSDEPLGTILTEFSRHNGVTLRAEGPELRALRLSVRFRSDNLEGFLRLLASDFRVRAETGAHGEIVLRGKR
jgi:transmembrane sensor